MKGRVAVTWGKTGIVAREQFLKQSESELVPLQKAQKPIIQAVIRSKMAVVPFPFPTGCATRWLFGVNRQFLS